MRIQIDRTTNTPIQRLIRRSIAFGIAPDQFLDLLYEALAPPEPPTEEETHP